MQRTLYFFLFLAIFCIKDVYAQPGLETGEVEVIKNFEAQLSEANMLRLQPTLPPLDTTTQRLTYTIPTQYLEIDYPAPTLKPIAMGTEKTPPTYKGYAKLGYGTPKSPYGEVSYHDVFNENLHLGAALRHHSADNSNKLDNQRFSTTGGTVDGTYYFEEQGFAVGANVGYEEDNRYQYGYDHEAFTFDKDEVRQRWRTFDMGVQFFNSERTIGDLNYSANIDFYRQTDYYAAKENGTNIELGLTKYFNEKHPLSVVLQTDFTSFENNESQKQTLHNFILRPDFGFHTDRFKIDVGTNLISHDDEFTIYPDIEATFNILGSRLAAFAGWEGDFVKNNMRNLSNYNPYINANATDFELRNTEYTEYYGGVKGQVSIVEYYGKLGLRDVNNLALYDNAITTRDFEVLYDSAQIFTIEGMLNVQILKDLELGGSVRSHVFDLNNQEKPWHLPSFEMNASARYKTLQDQLLLKGELYLANGVPYTFFNENNVRVSDNLNALIDLSVGAEYWFAQNIGAFFDVNNLFGNKRERWYLYPVYGLNVMGGVTARF